MFRNGGIVQLFTSPLQTLSITQDRKLTGKHCDRCTILYLKILELF